MTDFEELYNTYFRDVYLYIRRLSGNEHIAQEITSDTFFRAMHSIHSFRGDCDVRVWLCQIAKNCYLSYLRKHGRIQSMDADGVRELPDPAESIAEACARKDDVARIQKALHELNEPYKEVFLWHVYAELSFRQIGQIFGKTENWACVTYHRAKKMIREKMEVTKREK